MYKVEYGFGENFEQVKEWGIIDGLDYVEEESAEDAARFAFFTDGLENALFRVTPLVKNEFGEMEKETGYLYFSF